MDALPGPPITECKTVEAYTGWMGGVVANMGEAASYAIDAAAFDEDKSQAVFFATFGGFSHYVYMLHMNADGKCDKMIKVSCLEIVVTDHDTWY